MQFTSTVARSGGILAAAAVLGLAAASASAQNLLANPSFEDPITYDGPPFVGSWEGFSGGAGAGAGNSADSPRTGLLSLNMNIVATDNTFAGAFQDVPNLVPGTEATFGAWYRTPSNPFDVGFEARIEWRNSVTNTEISRTPNFSTPPSNAYAPFSITALVPAGADSARVVFAVQSFGPEPTNTGIVYVDDASFVVPEPASMGLLAGAGLIAVRRRRA